MMNKYNRFGRGSGVYTCINCGKRTRDTGNGEASTELCKACLNLMELENAHSDGYHDATPDPKCPLCQDTVE